MKKQDVLEHFGGPTKTAEALDLTPGAISQWKDPLPRAVADRVLAWFIRAGKLPPAKLMPDQREAA